MRTGIGEEYRTLIHYFLGELPEGEQEAVEERYMLDEAYAELRDEVEMDLVDAYVGGTLTALERRHFEQHYLVTRERKEGVKAAYLSRVYRERIAPPAARAPSAPGPVFLRERPMIPAMAAAIAGPALSGGARALCAWTCIPKGEADDSRHGGGDCSPCHRRRELAHLRVVGGPARD